jgi:hypothetical protein
MYSHVLYSDARYYTILTAERNKPVYINNSSMANVQTLTETLQSFTSETNVYTMQHFCKFI